MPVVQIHKIHFPCADLKCVFTAVLNCYYWSCFLCFVLQLDFKVNTFRNKLYNPKRSYSNTELLL